MAFSEEPVRTPVAIERIKIDLMTHAADSEEIPSADYFVEVRFSNGTIETRSGDLLPHITTTQKNSLLAFMNVLRQKAVAEFLP